MSRTRAGKQDSALERTWWLFIIVWVCFRPPSYCKDDRGTPFDMVRERVFETLQEIYPEELRTPNSRGEAVLPESV